MYFSEQLADIFCKPNLILIHFSENN